MGGRISSLISEDRRAALHVAFLQVLPNRVYALEEICFKAGSLYDSPEFAEQAKHVPVFSALRLHEWSILQLWRHFRTVSTNLMAWVCMAAEERLLFLCVRVSHRDPSCDV